MIISTRGAERGRLGCWPRPYAQNPYLLRLTEALSAEGIRCISHRYLAALVANPRDIHWLHLHWPEWMLRDKIRARARARAAWLFALVDLARARGIALAWTAHNLLGHDEPHRDLALEARRQLLARCEVVFGHFPAAERDVRALGFRGRFALTRHPHYARDYPPARPMPVARRTLGYAPDDIVLLVFGAIEIYKGIDRVVQAFARDAPPQARLHIAGAPSSSAALDAVVRATAGHPRVRIEAQFVEPDRVSTLFSAADALILGYREFYTSGTAMLALTFGTPVLGPPVHHLQDLVGRAFFVPLHDPADLGDALATLNRLAPNARTEARAYALSKTWQAVGHTVASTLFGNGGRF